MMKKILLSVALLGSLFAIVGISQPTFVPGVISITGTGTDSNTIYDMIVTYSGGSTGGVSASTVTSIVNNVVTTSSNELYFANATNENRYYLKRDFGAAGDGMVALMCSGTAGTNVLTATTNMLGSSTVFVNGDVGKAVTIYGAGTDNGNGYALNVSCYITQYLSATAVKISSNIITTFSQRSAVFGTDDTDNIQAAFNFFTNSPRASMELFCEQGIYVVAGPLLDTGTNYSHKNAQLIFPAVPRDGQHMRRFVIRGVGPSNQRGQINMNTNLVTGYDSVWWSFISRGDPQHGGRMMDFQNSDPATTCGLWSIPNELGGTTAHTRLNGVMVRVTDMGFRACYDANIGVLDLHGASGAEIERCSVSTGFGTSNPWCTGMTGTNGYGVHGAGHFNENPNTVHQVQIHNMYTGLRASENIWSGHLWLSGCYNGIDVQGGGAQMVFDWINMHAPYNAFFSWGAAANIYAPNLLVMDDIGLPGGAPFLVKELNTNSPALAGYIRYSFSENGATAGLLAFDGGASTKLKYEIFGADTPALNMQLSKHSVSNNVNALNFRLFGSVSPSVTFSASNEANVATSPMFKIGTHQGLGLSSQFTLGSDQTGHEYWKALLSGNVSMGVAGKTTTIYGNTTATGTFSGTLSGNLAASSNLPPTTGIQGWPANSAGFLENNGSGTLSWGTGSSGISSNTAWEISTNVVATDFGATNTVKVSDGVTSYWTNSPQVETNMVLKRLLVGGATAGSDAVNITGGLRTSSTVTSGGNVDAVQALRVAQRIWFESPYAGGAGIGPNNAALTNLVFSHGTSTASTEIGMLTHSRATTPSLTWQTVSNGAANFIASGTLTATNGYSSRSNVFFLAPTNTASANQVITVSGFDSGANTAHTKWADAPGAAGGILTYNGSGTNTIIYANVPSGRSNVWLDATTGFIWDADGFVSIDTWSRQLKDNGGSTALTWGSGIEMAGFTATDAAVTTAITNSGAIETTTLNVTGDIYNTQLPSAASLATDSNGKIQLARRNRYFEVFDEFTGNVAPGTRIGDLGWTATLINSAAGGAVTPISKPPGIGRYQFYANGAVDRGTLLSLGVPSAGSFANYSYGMTNTGWTADWTFTIDQTNNGRFVIGFINTIGINTNPPNGIYFSYEATNSNQVVATMVRDGTASTTNAGAAYVTSTGGTLIHAQIDFNTNGIATFTFSTNTPVTLNTTHPNPSSTCVPVFGVLTRAASPNLVMEADSFWWQGKEARY